MLSPCFNSLSTPKYINGLISTFDTLQFSCLLLRLRCELFTATAESPAAHLYPRIADRCRAVLRPHRQGSFKGPATITYSCLIFRYRYHFQFYPKLALRLKSDQTYRFRGVPTDEMNVSFAVVPFKADEVDLSTSLNTMLHGAELRDDQGSLVCLVSGPLSESLRGTQRQRRAWKNGLIATGYGATLQRTAISGTQPALTSKWNTAARTCSSLAESKSTRASRQNA